MWRIGLRNLFANRGRLAMTFVTVVLGVAFVSGTLVFADSINPGPGAVRTDVAVLVAPSGQENGGGYDFRPVLLPEQDRQRLAALPGVARADGVVDGYAAVVGKDGKVARPAGFADDLIGTNWTDGPRLRLREGRAPQGPGEIAVEQAAARNGELTVGTRTEALHQSGTETVTVVGIYSYHPVLRDGPGRAPALAFDTATAHRALQTPGTFTSVEITAGPGVSNQQLREAVAASLPVGIEAYDGDVLAQRSREQEEGDAATTAQILLTFTLIALLVGITLITNTFAMLVGQRTRQFGLLRAVGASRRQIEVMVLAEAAGIGILAAAVGVPTGFGLALPMIDFATAQDPILGDTLRITPTAVLWSLFVGIAVTMLAAWLPARRAAAAPPVVALQGDLVLAVTAVRRRSAIGLTLAAIAVLFCLLGLLGNHPPFTVAGVAGGFGMLIAAVLLAARLARPLIRVMVAPIRSSWLARLAAENALRNPRRTGATVAALLVGVALATGIAVFGASATHADRAAIEHSLRAPFVAVSIGGGQVSNEILTRIEAVPGVTSVSAIRRDTAGSGAQATPVAAIEPAAIGSLLHLDLRTGEPSDLARGAFVHKALAAERGWSRGDTVQIMINGQSVPVAITGVYADAALVGAGLLLPDEFADRHFRPGNGDTVLIGADSDGETFQRKLAETTADRPDVRMYTAEQYITAEASQLSTFIWVSIALLGLSVLIAALGIVNTLALSVLERTREVGLLRAIGMSRRKVRAMIRLESILITIAGGVLGVTVGILLGAMFQHGVLTRPAWQAALPLPQIAGLLVAMAIAGALAAEWPARRAARTDPLGAISSE
ncbi:ABC transporter permease [Plantactinospora sp. S1510]|uniref:ABC transporter permease n=1 Tax=Plantactinospora alkalitolerans TaxID=2789879 RepID=A0ABS0H489_9ACTN|nr:ABC transporter permease [Plantactinospora alkalitolerans]MBF9133278.1 ABC transporter permease [Plantactinospora alkalitolerans]